MAEATSEMTSTDRANSTPRTVHVVSHTHWDREWYQGAGRFRQMLVALVDELIKSPPAGGASFLLDGQMVVIEDYLDVRPRRAQDLTRLLAARTLEAGPWYVLADELIPTGESLVRNLLAGRRWLQRLGATPPPVLYCPDSFGHPAALPMLAAEFGFPLVIVSRGYGGARWPAGDLARWSAPSGEQVLLYHLSRKGYDIGENLPTGEASARERWATMVPELIGRSRNEHVLLPNGADHHARQRHLPTALEALAAAARPHRVIGSSLATFAESLVAAASRSGGIPGIRGELRDSYGYLWTLQGTFSARAAQKRRHAQVERLLLRDCEPWVALAGASRVALLHVAWKSLLLCHPHDTLCGCSTDLVARAMDARLDDAEDQAVGLRDDALLEMIGHDRDRAREEPGSWTPVTLVRNPSPRPRSGVAILRLSAFAADVKVGANASPGAVRTARARVPALDGVPPVQVLTKALAHERTEAPRHYPDNDEVLSAEVAAWVGNVPAYGIRGYRHVGRAAKDEIPNPVVVDGLSLSNGLISVRVTSDGRVTFDDHSTGVGIGDLLSWESREEAGDEYTASPRGPMLEYTYGGARVVHRGPVRGTIALEWRMKRRAHQVTGRVLLTVDAGARFLRIGVDAHNAAADHRLRLGIATHLRDARVWADAMFGPVERAPIVATPEDLKLETPPATAPLHRYVSLFTESRGATVYSDGLAEYEADANGTVFITLVRSVGELSRNDIPERPGHAGWPTPTPEAQCRGPFSARFALMCHGPRNAKTIDTIEQAADDVLLPLTGGTLRSALAVPAPAGGVSLDGLGLACSAITRTDDGDQLVLRCVNLTDETVTGAWTVPAGFSTAALARLDETIIGPLTVVDGRIALVAPPRAVITVLAR